MREIVIDTETTGLDFSEHRLVEIGCVELVDKYVTGKTFQRYLNPERAVEEAALAVHGLTDEFLAGHTCFRDEVNALLEFIGDAPLVAHNAQFDIGFVNAELAALGLAPIAQSRVVDTLQLARRKHPGAGNKLDDLCKRYNVDLSRRTKHGALLDAELLAEVYIDLCGARQTSLELAVAQKVDAGVVAVRQRPSPLPARLTDADLVAHAAFVETLGGEVVWREYYGN